VEFGRFAKPNKSNNDIMVIIQEVVFLQKNVYTDIEYVIDCEFNSCLISLNKTQITQVVTNLLKNARKVFILLT
jgi:nitrogen fixation/metabolism regulation signal transduction histidine kinase